MAAWNIGKARPHTNIDYLGVLDYLDNNRELPYKNPETAGLDALEKERLLGIKARGQAAVAEIKKMAELCKEMYGLDRCEPMAWLDGSNTKTRKYLWAQLKYSKYANNPISISIFAEISPQLNKARYRFSLEIKNDGTDKKQMEMYHSYLDMPLQPESSLVYVVGSNELGKPDTVEETADEIKNKIQNGTYKKVQICHIEEWTSDTTNDYMENTMLEAVGELIPYYKHVIGDEEIEYYPNISEYDPGITAEEYERILGDENIVKCAWLDTLYYLYLMGGIGTCKQIANTYGNGAAHYNTNAINVAKAVHKETNCPLCARDTGENQYWPVLFYGRDLADSADGVFSYKMREPLMEAIKALEERGVFQEMKEANKEFDKNLILYGPPGTGKTYNSATYAVAICDGKSVDELTDYDAVMTRYNELKKAGRIAFTTFHQSYGYEEFIEGIKPIIDENKQDIGYTIESGVFKEFCENAKSIVRTKNDDSIDAGARIWKLTIMNGDLNQVKQECFEENNVRMEFDIDSDEVRSFVEDVKLGDIILSFKTRKTIDGIAIVTDEAAVLQDKSMYKTARAVKWLAKNIDEDITDINNGKLLHRMTFAKVPNMNVKDVIKLAEKVNPGLESTVIEENTEPHVFIIDEINRGNISKIFGELITLIESTKRAGMSESASAILPYSGDEFSVPSNVYILGTMNTADRSIALMDTALRRRFQFIEMMPDSDVLRKIHADKVEDLDVAAVLDKINERITFLYDREHTIGHAFFTGLKDDATLAKLQSIFEKSVIPLLQEYFYEDYQKIQLVLGDNAKTDDNLKFILDEKVVAKNIFKGNVEDVIDLPEKRYSINKAAFGNINSYKEIKRVFLRMLRSMKDFPSKVFNDASLKVDQMNLYELFINMYLQEVRQLVKRGIKSNYVGQEDNLRYYKGKLLVNQQVRANLAHKERFYVAYEEFHPNMAENRLVKATLAKLQKLTTSAENSKEIRQLLTAFEMVDASVNYAKDFSQVVINRNTKDYEMLMQWSKVFLMNKSFTTFSGSTASRALLFPMESVYESYVAQQMKKVMNPEGWDVSSQDKGHYLFTEPRRQFALRPDIVMKRGERTVILDTKWKSLVDNERVNYGISQADMYQMYAYSKKYNTSEIWLLYPVNDEMRNHKPIRFESGDGTTVNLHFVDVDKIEESLQELRSKLEAGE